MKKNKNFGYAVLLGTIVASVIIGIGLWIAYDKASEKTQEKQLFDTSIIESNWCGENGDGKIRMVSATVVKDVDGLYTLEDETGNLWEVADVLIHPDDFLLLWIADCETPDDFTDDLILKCWVEVH